MRLKKFNQLNEGLHDEHTFKTETDCTYYAKYFFEKEFENFESEYVNNCVVYWDYELNVTSRGIDYILPTIKKIVVTMEIATFNVENDEEDSEEIEYTYDIMSADIEVENKGETTTIPYSPEDVEITITEKDEKPQILIYF